MSTNDVRTETREVSNFDRVALAGFGQLVITQGDQESLVIEAPQDLLGRIETKVEDGKLTIGFKRSWIGLTMSSPSVSAANRSGTT